MNSLLPLLLAAVGLALLWVVVVVPQQKRVRAHDEIVRTLAVGQEVLTTSGLVGTIVDLDDGFARLEVAPGVVLRFDRRAVGARLDDPGGEPDLPRSPSTGTDG